MKRNTSRKEVGVRRTFTNRYNKVRSDRECRNKRREASRGLCQIDLAERTSEVQQEHLQWGILLMGWTILW